MKNCGIINAVAGYGLRTVRIAAIIMTRAAYLRSRVAAVSGYGCGMRDFEGLQKKGKKSITARNVRSLFAEAGKKRNTLSFFRVAAGLVNSVERSGTAINLSSGKSW